MLHGTKNYVSHLQSAFSEIIPDYLRDKILASLDGIMFYDRTVSEIVKSVVAMLHLCFEYKIRLHYYWSTVKTDICTFVCACINCLSTIGGGKRLRPYGPAVHGREANDPLQFDCIELGPGSGDAKYVVMPRDDYSDYNWGFPFPDTSAEEAAVAITKRCAAIGVPKCFMSDGPTHSRNETLRLVSKGLKGLHHFKLPYCPCSDGAVECLGP